MPTLWMLCGVPGSGKSYWTGSQNFNSKSISMISTDNIIEERASRVGKTYSDVFKKEIKSATTEMNNNLREAIKKRKDIVWDQTNLTINTRRKKLIQIPDTYTKIGVYFTVPDEEELKRRLNNRPGKTIPHNLVLGMISQYQFPSLEEGFDEIIEIDNSLPANRCNASSNVENQ